MSLTPSLTQIDPPLPPGETLPTMYDLPSENPEEPGLSDQFHIWQPELLGATFVPPRWEPDTVFWASDLHLYYDPKNPLWYKRPDWFAVLGADRLYGGEELRLSYVMWQEGVRPTIAVELLSPSTMQEDQGQKPGSRLPVATPNPANGQSNGNGTGTGRSTAKPPSKWQVYEQILGIPYYVLFDRRTDHLQIFTLEQGVYQPVALTEPRYWMDEIGLGLGLWEGSFQGVTRLWLRWFDETGQWVPTEAERQQQRAETAEQALTQTQQELDVERQRAEHLAAQLRALGIDPDAP
ncbi:MAG: Uma2 family endonuclease [Prochlorothrix sp.]|nr:Uma2 family endonuclease [Prochlorothrix sp.]